jgi:inosine-uridine nucleoside N-ribohydrolase
MLFAAVGLLGCKSSEPVIPNVIFDTDMDSDIDDVGALAMLYHLQKQGLIHLSGVIVTSDDPYAPTCVSAINHFYGYADMPVGFPENQPGLTNHSRYTKQLSEEFPRKLQQWEDAPAATATYRKLLAGSADNSVIIVTVGHLSSLQNLLRSQPDAYSPLDGKALINAKVQKWYCMGGQFPEGKEANFYRPDPASTVYCLAHWEKEVVFSGWEIGQNIITGTEELKTALPVNHPVYRGYELYNQFAGRSSWDQTAVLLLTAQAQDFFEFENHGKCIVRPDGSNYWEAGAQGNHYFLKFKEDTNLSDISRLITNLMLGQQ